MMDTIIAVDVTPRWMYGHTQLDEDEAAVPVACDMMLAMAKVSQRLNVLMTEGSPGFKNLAGVRTVITVELENLHRIRLTGLKGDRLLLCGVYGDECVFETARRRKSRGRKRRRWPPRSTFRPSGMTRLISASWWMARRR
jgi:hypothetical protein